MKDKRYSPPYCFGVAFHACPPSGDYRVEGAIGDAAMIYAQADKLAVFSVINTIANRAGTIPLGATLLEYPWRVTQNDVIVASGNAG